MSDEAILAAVVAPKSDQLNSDDLAAGEIVVQIKAVRMNETGDQKTTIEISGGHKPWKPCKSMVRVMLATWGKKWRTEWPGHWVALFRDEKVTFGDKDNPVGGIRVRAMTGLTQPTRVMLTTTRGVKKPYTVVPLTPPTSAGDAPDLPWLLGWLKAGTAKGWTPDAIAELLRAHGSPDGKAATLPAEKRREVAAIVKEPPKPVEEEPPPEEGGPDLSEFGTPPWEQGGGK